MAARVDAVALEAKLRASLVKDRQRRSRVRPGPDGTMIVVPSGTTVGLAFALSLMTGEDEDALMNRVGGY